MLRGKGKKAAGTLSLGQKTKITSLLRRIETLRNIYTGRRFIMYKALREKIDVVVFDMDQTILSTHTRGAVFQVKSDGGGAKVCVEDLRDKIVPTFKDLVPALIESGITVGIATNSDKRMARIGQVGGFELATQVMDMAFNKHPMYEKIKANLIYACWRASSPIPNVVGKNNHLARIWEIKTARENGRSDTMPEEEFLDMIVNSSSDYWQQMKIKPSLSKDECMNRSLLLDDGVENIVCAHAIKCHAQLVTDATIGLSKKDWEIAVTSILKGGFELDPIPTEGDSKEIKESSTACCLT